MRIRTITGAGLQQSSTRSARINLSKNGWSSSTRGTSGAKVAISSRTGCSDARGWKQHARRSTARLRADRRVRYNPRFSGDIANMKLKLYALRPDPLPVRPAPLTRAWMDAVPDNHAYRCLPLNIANSHGWELLSPCAF